MHQRAVRLVCTVMILFGGLLAPAAAQWTTLSITERYDSWTQYNAAGGTYTSRPAPINLLPTNFFNQSFGDPQVIYTDTGDWLITGYGDNNLAEQTVCDGSYVVRRSNTNGSFQIPAGPALSIPPVVPQCTGYLGVGPGVTKTLTATPSGYKYFGVIPAGGNNTAWLTWVVSADGQAWQFAKQGGGTTTDPRLSLQLIRRSDLRPSPLGSTIGHFQHVVMQYNKYDGYFYIIFGYAADACPCPPGTAPGIRATWWRIRFDSTNTFGLPPAGGGQYEIQRRVGASYVAETGLIPPTDYWTVLAMYPNFGNDDNPVDPMGLTQLYRQDGSFDSWLFLYQPQGGFGSKPSPVAYVKGTSTGAGGGEFSFGVARALATGPVFGGGTYVACDPESPAPNTVHVNQSGWQADGSPQLYGFVVVSLPASCGSIGQQGLVMVKLNLSDAALFYTLAPCRVADTRNTPNGPLSGPALAAGTTRTFVIPQQCGIPAGVRALSFNITITQPNTSGKLRLFPAGVPVPLAWAISYGANQTRANNTVMGASATGGVSVYTEQSFGTTHFILDVNGYFK